MENSNFEKIFRCFIAFVLGLASAAIFGFKLCFVAFFVFFLIFLFFVFFSKRIKLKKFSLFSFAAVCGAFWFCFNVFFTYNFSKEFDGEDRVVVGIIKDFEYYETGKISYLIKVKKIGEKDVIFPFNLKIYLTTKDEVDCDYFDEIKVKLRLKNAVKNEWFNIFDSNSSKKIFLTGKVLSKIRVYRRGSFFARFLNFRDDMIENIDLFVEEPYNFLASGVVFGKTRDLPFKDRRNINKCGLSHMFAVSGLHIAILSIFLILIFRLFKFPGIFSFLCLSFCMLIYCFLVGFSPSVLRACIMAFCVSFFMFFNKKVKPSYSLSFAAFLVVLIWPMSILGLSFIMSFSSCFGIIFFKDRILNFILIKTKIANKLVIFVLEGFSTSLAATIPTSFFLMFSFGKISIVAPFVNLFIVPFLPVIYIVSVLICIFGFFSYDISFFLGYICEGLFGSILYFLGYIAKFPFCYIPTNYFFVKCIVFGLFLFTITCFFIYRNFLFSKNFVLICSAIIILPSFANFILGRDTTKIYVLKNGFGSCVIIRGKKKTVVVNCGGAASSGRNLVDFLDSKGIRKVDIFILASSDKRHVLGAIDFIRTMPPTCFILAKKAQNSNIVDYVNTKKTNVILNDKFYLEYLPISINVLNRGNEFGFYLSINGLCLGYSRTLDFMAYMSNKRHINFAILDEKIKDSKDLKSLEVKTCLGLLNKDFELESVESVGEGRVTEFTIDGCHFKRGEF